MKRFKKFVPYLVLVIVLLGAAVAVYFVAKNSVRKGKSDAELYGQMKQECEASYRAYTEKGIVYAANPCDDRMLIRDFSQRYGHEYRP